jgi:ureidoglycolate hydrolase
MGEIATEPLSKPGFARFGEVVELAGAERIAINQGFAQRVNGLARAAPRAAASTCRSSRRGPARSRSR